MGLEPGLGNEGGNGATYTRLVDEWTLDPNSNSRSKYEVFTTGASVDTLAMEKKTGKKLHTDMVKAELRAKFLKNLTIMGVGTNRIEENQVKSRKELVRDTGRRVADIKAEMERKTHDASRDAANKRWKMNKWRKEVETNKC